MPLDASAFSVMMRVALALLSVAIGMPTKSAVETSSFELSGCCGDAMTASHQVRYAVQSQRRHYS